MSDIEVTGLDLSSPETIKKGLHDIVERQKTLAARGDNMHEQITEKAKEFSKLSARLTEIENRKSARASMDGEAGLEKFVRRDGSIRMQGEVTVDRPWAEGLLDGAPVCDWQADLQRAVQQHTIVKAISKNGAPKSLAACRDIMNRAPDTVKRLWSDTAGAGAEWVPDQHLAQFERDLTAERRVASLFQTMQMNNKNEILPILQTGLKPFKKGAATSDDPAQFASSSLTTSSRNITAVGMVVRAQVDDDASEDSIIAAMPLIESELRTAIIDGEEDCIINGNTDAADGTGNTDEYANWNIRSRWGSSTGSSADHRRCYIGLRHRAFDVSNTTDQGSAQTITGFLAARAKLASPHGVSGSLVAVVSPEYYLVKMLGFGTESGATAGVIGVDQYGPNATILSGELGQLLGVPLIISEMMGGDLDADGLYSSGGSKTGMLMFNRDRFKIGRLRNSYAMQADVTRGLQNLVLTDRHVFFSIDGDTKKNVHYSFNLDAA